MGSEATKGMAIGFLAGFVGMELLGGRHQGEYRTAITFYALCAGVVGGWIGYMIGRAHD